MRILAVGNLYPPRHMGGYEAVWQAADAHLRQAGHVVHTLVSDAPATVCGTVAADGPSVERTLHSYWRDHRWPRMSARQRLAVERHNARVLRAALYRHSPDLVMWWAMGGMSLSLIEQARRAGVPALGVVHDEWMAYGPIVDLWLRAWRRRPQLARAAGALTGLPVAVDFDRAGSWSFNSDFTRRRSVGRDGIVLRRTSVIAPGVDPDAFPAAPARPWAGRLACLGRVDERKGLRVAITALASLPECGLRVVGDGDQHHLCELRRLAEKLGVGDRVSFDGAVPRARLASVYAEADAVLFPVTWEEPFGLVPLEAMSVGRPVVATGTGGSAEYLRDGRNALLVAPGDAGALARAVGRLATEAPLRRQLRSGGALTAAEHSERAFLESLEREVLRAADATPVL